MTSCRKAHDREFALLFNSFWYLVFLPAVVCLFWLSPRAWRTPLLLVASYVFYMSWKPIYGLLIFGMTLANYFFGLAIARSQNRKKHWLAAGVTFNLLLLGIFKYAYFTFDLAQDVAGAFGRHLPAIPWQIILPLGISFFVFEFIHYLADVTKGGKPVNSFVQFALFASFFPTQIAGPIKRYQDFIPQLANDGRLNASMLDSGLGLILFGLFKKVVFADNLSVVVQSAFSRPDLLTGFDMWLAVYAFAFQIYFDFSGYTDIARGSALLFGYKVPLNFNLPYLAGSISEFWHRWHISLSTWLRDYLFIPLGGSRSGKLMTYRNLLITMVLGGLWHGAALHFVVWGAYQGILLVIHKQWQHMSDRIAWMSGVKNSAVYRTIAVIGTFHLACIGWVFFRADSFAMAMQIIGKLLFVDRLSSLPATALSIMNTTDLVIFMLLPFVLVLLFAGQILSGYLASRKAPLVVPIGLKAVYVAAVLSLLLVFSPDTSPKFIYFQF
jgi:D-alanyl-lipoteichoic acid acyltransferase DltB (MBOAT superfamily)